MASSQEVDRIRELENHLKELDKLTQTQVSLVQALRGIQNNISPQEVERTKKAFATIFDETRRKQVQYQDKIKIAMEILINESFPEITG